MTFDIFITVMFLVIVLIVSLVMFVNDNTFIFTKTTNRRKRYIRPDKSKTHIHK